MNRAFADVPQDAPALHPKATGPARIIARDAIHALPHQFGHEQARAQFFQHGVQIVAGVGQARSQAQVVRAARVAGGFHAEFAG